MSSRITAIINTTGPFEYEITDDNAQPWGTGTNGLDDQVEDIILADNKSLSQRMIDDGASVVFNANERHGNQSYDLINNLEMIHSYSDIVGSYGFADGYAFGYINPKINQSSYNTVQYPRYSYTSIPPSTLNDTELSIEAVFKYDTYFEQISYENNDWYYNGKTMPLWTLSNSSLDLTNLFQERGNPGNYFLSCSFNISVDNETNKSFIRFYINGFDTTNNNDNMFGSSFDSELISYTTEFDPDIAYHVVILVDERKRLWLYVNGEVTNRICGITWPTISEDWILSINPDLSISSTNMNNGLLQVDSIALYNGLMTQKFILEHNEYIKQQHDYRRENRLYFRKNDYRYATTDDEGYFLPHEKYLKKLHYNTESESWGITQTDVLKTVVSMSASRNHLAYVFDDGTMDGRGVNNNQQINFGSITDAITCAAIDEITVVLRKDGSLEVIGSPVDSWNIGIIPNGIGKIVDIKGGLNHIVALSSTGKVFAWGRNNDGQCNVPENLPPIVQIAAGDSSTYVLDFSGRVWAWGSSTYNETNLTDFESNVFTQIEADGYTLVGLKPNNMLEIATDIPLLNIEKAPYSIITSLSVGKNSILIGHGHTTYVADGTIDYIIDNDVEVNSLIDNSFAFDIRDDINGGHIKQVYLSYHAAFVINNDLSLDSWGRNSYTNGYQLTNLPSNIGPVVDIKGGYFVTAVEESGNVRVWGRTSNNVGQIPPTAINIKNVFTNGYHIYAVKNDGTVISWGESRSWVPSTIPANYKKVVILEQGKYIIVLDHDGNIHELSENNTITSELSNISDYVIDFDITSEEYYGDTQAHYRRIAYVLLRNGKCLTIDASDVPQKFVFKKSMLEHNVVAIQGKSFLFSNRRAAYEDIREMTNTIQLTYYDSNIYGAPMSLNPNSRVGLWTENYYLAYVDNIPPRYSEESE